VRIAFALVQTVFWRRRAIAIGGLAVLLLAVVLLVRACGGGSDGDAPSASAVDAKPPPQLPRGGRVILPGHRIVAYYGSPQDRELGTLGIGRPRQAGARLAKTTHAYARYGPAWPAMELIAVVANGAPGDDGLYRTRIRDQVIGRYLKAARAMKALLILDIQPGRSDFLKESMTLSKWLRQPDVSLALDPEWRVNAPDVPAQVIGSVTAREVNAVSFWLAGIVRRGHLPQKLLLLHRFTQDMIAGQDDLKARPGLAITINVDGFGGQAVKRVKYKQFAAENTRFFNGFKLFYEEDSGLMRPRQVVHLRPPPNVVVYE
jgi:hypothetical protein